MGDVEIPSNPKRVVIDYFMGDAAIGSVNEEKDLGVLVSNTLVSSVLKLLKQQIKF